jgi:hypothetical protein
MQQIGRSTGAQRREARFAEAKLVSGVSVLGLAGTLRETYGSSDFLLTRFFCNVPATQLLWIERPRLGLSDPRIC